MKFFCLVLFFGFTSGTEIVSSDRSLGSASLSERPVAKVVKLLRDMAKTLEKEAEHDDETFEAMECFCEANLKSKTKSVSDAEGRISDLTGEIERLTARGAELSTELQALEKETAKAKRALDTAGALRAKELAEFNKSEKEMLSAIGSIRAATVVLSKKSPAALLGHTQQLRTATAGAASAAAQREAAPPEDAGAFDAVRAAGLAHMSLLAEALSPTQQKMLRRLPDLMQQPGGSSSEVFGILQAMQENFAGNLDKARSDEANDVKAYEDLKSAKTLEIKTMEEQFDDKTDEESSAAEGRERAHVDLEDTQAALESDTKFLAELKTQCGDLKKIFEERKKTRQDEISAVSKATELLGSDDSFDTFGRTYGSSAAAALVQRRLREGRREQRRQSAGAPGVHGPPLQHSAALVQKAAGGSSAARGRRGDGEGGVSTATRVIKELMHKLEKQKKIDAEKREFCIEEQHKNGLELDEFVHQRELLNARAEKLEGTMKKLKRELGELAKKIADLNLEMKRSGQNREAENKQFQVTLADQRASRELLEQALDVLKEVYAKPGASLLQVHRSRRQLGPAFFATDADETAAPGDDAVDRPPREYSIEDTPSWMIHAKSFEAEMEAPPPAPEPSSEEEAAPDTGLVEEPIGEDGVPPRPDADLVEEKGTVSRKALPGMPKFKNFEKNGNAGGVIGMIKKIIFDTKQLEEETIHDEEAAQHDYEQFTKETTAVVKVAEHDTVNKRNERAHAEMDLIEVNDELWAANKQYRTAKDLSVKLGAECDHLVKNYYAIQQAHDEEIAGLTDGIAVLAGADGGPSGTGPGAEHAQ